MRQEIGFNTAGRHKFRQWYQEQTGKAITDAEIQAEFDDRIDMDNRFIIVLGDSETLSDEPEDFDIEESDVEGFDLTSIEVEGLSGGKVRIIGYVASEAKEGGEVEAFDRIATTGNVSVLVGHEAAVRIFNEVCEGVKKRFEAGDPFRRKPHFDTVRVGRMSDVSLPDPDDGNGIWVKTSNGGSEFSLWIRDCGGYGLFIEAYEAGREMELPVKTMVVE